MVNMRRGRLTLALLVLSTLLLSWMTAGVSFAGTQTWNGITLTTPNTYSSCSNTPVTDTITLTGVSAYDATVPFDVRVEGRIAVEYVTNTGRQLVNGQEFLINQSGDVAVTVTYPPVSEWPVLANGTREIHVDVSLQVVGYTSTITEYLYTFGPGQDWDVFCIGDVPPPPPPVSQGCTPGYWRQAHHYDSWTGYTPTQTFNSVFGVGPSITLGDAVKQGGGGADALARHAVAALLNSTSPQVDYPYTTAQVIQLVKDAYSNAITYEGAKDLLEAANEAGCPLN
jgi:hypothetical protein